MSTRACGLVTVACATALSACTLLGIPIGAAIATSRNSDPRVERGEKPRHSVGLHIGAGMGIGLLVDALVIVLVIAPDLANRHY